MNQRLFHHELTRLKLEQLHHEARVHDLPKHSREHNGVATRPTKRTRLGALVAALGERVLQVLSAGSLQRHQDRTCPWGLD